MPLQDVRIEDLEEEVRSREAVAEEMQDRWNFLSFKHQLLIDMVCSSMGMQFLGPKHMLWMFITLTIDLNFVPKPSQETVCSLMAVGVAGSRQRGARAAQGHCRHHVKRHCACYVKIHSCNMTVL